MFVGVRILEFVEVLLGEGEDVEDGDAKGFDVDGGECECPVIGTLDGVCVIVLCGERGEGGDAGGFGVDGREGECAFVVG